MRAPMPGVAEQHLPIDAPVATVWRVLTDVAAYPAWNPFVVRVDGAVGAIGDTFRLHVRWRDGRETLAGEVLTTLEPPTRGDDGVQRATFAYRFTGPLATFGLVRAVRTQTLAQAPGGPTLYTSREPFHGLFARFVPLARVREGTEDMARALRDRAETAGRDVATR